MDSCKAMRSIYTLRSLEGICIPGTLSKLEHIKDQSFYNIDHIYPQSMVKGR